MVARVLTIAVALLFAAACEKTNHENIDKWSGTQKGPGKLKKALADEDLDPDLSAHAAANLIKRQQDNDVREALDKMSPGRRQQVLAKLAPRLWDLARIENENMLPNAQQIVAKDALIFARKYGDDALKQQIDNYLTDWYAVSSYEARAGVGATLGAAVMRMLGPNAGKKLMSVANSVLAAPGQDKVKNRIGDELMLGLAASGNTEAVKFLLDLVKLERGDATQGKRALSALYKTYVDPGGLFDIASPEPLVSSLDQLVAIAKDDSLSGQIINDAVALIRAVGAPACLPPLLGMVQTPHRESRFKYVAAFNALKCGGAKAVTEVVRALPDQGAYVKDELQGSISGEIARMSPRDQVLAALRELLGDKSTVARWVAIEALGAMKSVEDAPKIAALSGNKDKLVGYWGERNPENKPDPSLGQRAKEVSAALAKGETPK
jgi:HEAT repeat protein